jgi:hypothetical protein
MAASAIDLSSVQTINYGGGQTLTYDPTTGNYYDSGGNLLQPSDVAAYGAPVSVTQGIGTSTPASTATGMPSAGSSAASPTGGASTGTTSTFSAILGAFSGIGSAINPPKTVNGVPMVYSAAAGGYIPSSSAGAAVSNLSLSPTIIIVGLAAIGLIAFLALRK